MARMIDETDIDEWYESEKERLSKTMQRALMKGAPFEKEKERFDKDFKALIASYYKRLTDADKYKARLERRQIPVRRFQQWREQKRVSLELWWKIKTEQYKKWRFEREYKRLFPLEKKKKI